MFDPDLPLGDQEPIDYTDAYNRQYGSNALSVQACGREMLVFSPLDRPRTITTFDRACRKRQVTVTHVIESLTLSRDARPDTDDYACVMYGPDTEYLTKTEAQPLLRQANRGDGSLFKVVHLF